MHTRTHVNFTKLGRRRRGAGHRWHRFPWARWPAERILDLRLSDLGVTIAGTWLEEPIQAIHEDLDRRGLRVRPHFWLAEEWFSPGDVPGIAIPFYLAHPRLMKLERSQMLEVEGGSLDSCLKILRHETGHVVQHAYQIQRRKRWQQLFGKSSLRYPEHYRPRPSSKRFVLHLDRWYAQAHPDEDFAETFAVWFQPRPLWKKRYAGWPALKKVEYVDELMEELRDTRPVVASRMCVDSISRTRKTLREHYQEKRARYAISYPRNYDRDLKCLFSDTPARARTETAAAFLRRNRAEIRQQVARWTGEYEFTLDQVLKDMIQRCRELQLHAAGAERQLKLDFALLLTVQTMHCLYSGRAWHAL
ncbi:MAG TPA: putative zinc-binding metallopeptidase [Planctomycetota bacterium]|nr:putative zinc-binding metallopeptidase [Planctomycetota bacterium]